MAYWNGWRHGWPRRKKDCVGRWVRLRGRLVNGFFAIPKGTLMEIKSPAGGGFGLTGKACECCRLQASIGRVFPMDLDLLPEGFDPNRSDVAPEEDDRG